MSSGVNFRVRKIIKRDGTYQNLRLSAIEERITNLVLRFGLFLTTYDPDLILHEQATYVNEICLKVIEQIYKIDPSTPIATGTIDQITIDVCESMGSSYPDASKLAAVIMMDNLHRNLRKRGGLTQLAATIRGRNSFNPTDGSTYCILQDEYCDFVREHESAIESMIVYERDYDYPLDGCKVLEKQYLMKAYEPKGTGSGFVKRIIESPQNMLMRVAIYLYMKYNGGDLARIQEIYTYLSQRRITPATPILLRSATNNASLASCFLGVIPDSIEGIAECVTHAMTSSKGGGGLAFRIDYLRATNSYIKRTNGHSAGPMPFIDIFNTVAKHVNQGGHRPGAISFYLSVWHLDIITFIKSRSEFSESAIRALGIFPGVIMPALFMERVARDEQWTLFCPSVASDLVTLYDDDFTRRYQELEQQYLGGVNACCRQIAASALYAIIFGLKVETGMPYIMDLEATAGMHNLLHDEPLTANLCTEVVLHTDLPKQGLAVCNLTTVGTNANLVYDSAHDTKQWPVVREFPLFKLPANELIVPMDLASEHPQIVEQLMADRYFRGREGMSLDRLGIACSAYMAASMLNRAIDINDYPNQAARDTCLRDRPIGVGQQGFGDCVMMMGYSFDDEEVTVINREVAAIIYYFAQLSSVDYAKKHGSVPSIEKTRIMKFSHLQPDAYKKYTGFDVLLPAYLDYPYLLAQCHEHGFANGVVTAAQPTETSAKLNGSSEMWEPRKGIIYAMKNDNVVSIVRNHVALQLLSASRLWTYELSQHVDFNGGSLLGYDKLPHDIRRIFKTIREYDQTRLIDLTADREPHISMAQSLNVYTKTTALQEVCELDMYAYIKKLRTRSYYLRIPQADTFRPSAVMANYDAAPETASQSAAIESRAPSCSMCE